MEESRNRKPETPSFDDSFAVVMDDLIEGCQIISPEWRYLYVNNTVLGHARRSREELIGRTMMEVYPGIEQTEMFAVLREAMEGRVVRRMENEFTFPDGSTGWFELRFNPVPEGIFILSLDITERKVAEASIAHLNDVLRGVRNVNQLITREKDRSRLIQSACDLLVEARGFQAVLIGLTDQEGEKVVSYARAGESLSELNDRLERGGIPACAEEAMTHRTILRRQSPGECDEDCPCAAGFAAGDHVVAIGLEHDTRLFGFMILFVPPVPGEDEGEEDSLLHEAAGDLAFALHAMEVDAERTLARRDLSHAEEQLRQAQKLEAVGRLAGGVAHDFNNLLMVQMGYCDLIMETLQADDPMAAELAEIQACAERATQLTRQLLAFSRKQALQPRVLNINRIVANAEKLLRRLIGEDIDLEANLDPELGQVEADPGQIEQVIMNLAVNARDAMPRGGQLTLETGNVYLDEAYAEEHVGAKAGPHVMLAITDTGEGMDKETQDRLFEPFFTTKERGKGTGLGLATVYGIVKQSGGNIWVYSEPGQGTTFKIYLPRVQGEVEERGEAAAQEWRGSGETILVVEDDPALRTLLSRMLEGLGFEAAMAANGAEALERLESEDLQPTLLITDVVLPGMGGSELAERAGALRPGLKVLFTSGYTDASIVHRGVLRADTPFLQKPFTRNDLAVKIRGILGGG